MRRILFTLLTLLFPVVEAEAATLGAMPTGQWASASNGAGYDYEGRKGFAAHSGQLVGRWDF